jgi:DNA-binding response OmpR family regulator
MARHRAADACPAQRRRYTVFVVEDDNDMLKLVGEVLAKAGFISLRAQPPGDQRRVQQPPGPTSSARRVVAGCRRLQHPRAHPPQRKLSRLPVIMMTGKSEVTDAARGLSLGATVT